MAVRWGWGCGLGLVFLAQGALPQSGAAPPPPPATTEDALHAMYNVAAVIFTGQVSAVRVRGVSGGATGVVEIDFVVEHAVRGVSGSRYTMIEWNGLWTAADTPFRTGQRYLMLLYAPTDSGLSSPVGGTDGAIPIVGIGTGMGGATVPGPVGAQSVASAASVNAVAQTQVDLRWVATRVARPTGYAAPVAAHPVLGNGRIAGGGAGGSAITAAVPGPPVQSMGYTQVLALLRGWDQEDHATQ